MIQVILVTFDATGFVTVYKRRVSTIQILMPLLKNFYEGGFEHAFLLTVL